MNWLQKISQQRPFGRQPSKKRLNYIQKAEEEADAHGGYLPVFDQLDPKLRGYIGAFPQYFTHIPRSEDNPNKGVVEETNIDWDNLSPSDWRYGIDNTLPIHQIDSLVKDIYNPTIRSLVIKYLGLDGMGKRNLEQLAHDIGLTKQRTHQLLQKGLDQINAELAARQNWDVEDETTIESPSIAEAVLEPWSVMPQIPGELIQGDRLHPFYEAQIQDWVLNLYRRGEISALEGGILNKRLGLYGNQRENIQDIAEYFKIPMGKAESIFNHIIQGFINWRNKRVPVEIRRQNT